MANTQIHVQLASTVVCHTRSTEYKYLVLV